MIERFNKIPIPVPIVGGGLKAGGLLTEVTLNSVSWAALPVTALTNRNGMGIQNSSNTEIKVNFDNSVVTYTGWIVAPGGELFIDLSEDVVVYAKAKNGSPIITVMEIA